MARTRIVGYWNVFVAGLLVAMLSFVSGCAREGAEDFAEETPEVKEGGHSHKDGGHAKAVNESDEEKERRLFMTPGGKYTREDILANGEVLPSEKFKGIRAKHDNKLEPGDKICPVTLTAKANPKFSWIIDGQKYEFCCPPCIEDFVATAKEHPEEIKSPDSYRQK